MKFIDWLPTSSRLFLLYILSIMSICQFSWSECTQICSKAPRPESRIQSISHANIFGSHWHFELSRTLPSKGIESSISWYRFANFQVSNRNNFWYILNEFLILMGNSDSIFLNWFNIQLKWGNFRRKGSVIYFIFLCLAEGR